MTIARDSAREGEIIPHLRRSYGHIADILPVPHLIQIQIDSYRRFLEQGLKELFDELSPVQDFSGSRMDLYFTSYSFDEPKYEEAECRRREMTYAAPLKVNVQLLIKETGEVKEQKIFMGDFPLMTTDGTFIINGAERVVVSQLVRSPGVYFTLERDATSGRDLCFAKLIPNRGAWLEFETSSKDVISVKVDRKRKVPITVLLRAIDQDPEIEGDAQLGTEERLLAVLGAADTDPDHRYIRSTLERETARGPLQNEEEALVEFYHRLRPGDPPTLDNARSLLFALFFNPRRYDLGKVGRYKVNRRLGLDIPQGQRTLTPQDLVAIAWEITRLNNGQGRPDDIDHLGNRRVRTVGELIQNQFRIGLLRMERVVRERMTIIDPEAATPSALINVRPVVAAIKEFFGGSQLSQFMDQTNPLAELTHKRRLSALGPGGLSRERAGFDVRDVHHSHYGRICPIETPEGPNIGLLGSMATYARVNPYGFLEAPYRRVVRELPARSPDLVNRTLRVPVVDRQGNLLYTAGTVITPEVAKALARTPVAKAVPVRPFVIPVVHYLSADQDEQYTIA
ncbi:MAG: DNA-directed RNA polymerase subunit beta, partial [Dehalococcoidia bacterium]